MSGKEQAITDALKQIVQRKNWKQSDKDRFFEDKGKYIHFAIEFSQSDEVPENLAYTHAQFEDFTSSIIGYLWCTNKRLFFTGVIEVGGLFSSSSAPKYKEFSYSNIRNAQFIKGSAIKAGVLFWT